MARLKLKPLPRSNARTAWELLQDVKRAITEEPKRANMHVFERKESPANGGPACGTVGCFAGWVNILTGQHQERTVSETTLAERALGPSLDYYFQDAGGSVRSYFNEGAGDLCELTTVGTRAHARAVVQRINRFMDANEDALKGRQLQKVDGRLVPVAP